jgi:hypothetical protein
MSEIFAEKKPGTASTVTGLANGTDQCLIILSLRKRKRLPVQPNSVFGFYPEISYKCRSTRHSSLAAFPILSIFMTTGAGSTTRTIPLTAIAMSCWRVSRSRCDADEGVLTDPVRRGRDP